MAMADDPLPTPAAPPAARVVPVGAAEREAMRALFVRVFGHPLSEDEWHWKYADGGGVGVGLYEEGQLLAHYGGMPRRVLFEGREALACQVCDVMVDPACRRALTRRGPLWQITSRFLELQIGDVQPHLLGFGFPTDRHHLAAERLGLYGSVDKMLCASWPAAGTIGEPGRVQSLGEPDLQPGAGPSRALEACWRAMATALPGRIVGIRDAAWVRHRYLRHPRFRYQLLLLRSRWWRRPLGVAVVRAHEGHLEWVDAIGDPAHWPALLQAVRRCAAQLGLPRVDAWITESQKALLDGLAGDASWRPLGIDVPANTYTPGPAVERLRGRWLLMAGDTDFR